MWGKYVESEIRDAAKEAKDERASQAAVMRVVDKIMRDPEDETEEKEAPKGRFRDPAAIAGLVKKG